ncbi:PREDICTED: m-AAA protease-interacting protein 1, mitochondrial [Gavialis gangeticus]|uniref:m-AAA protease-interacting protein 1, mitochondrial n=1 Tax=Gavialis gangeticus TaxID=94835 RepID=UPI00092EE270|nr:PREDICTED: m-AAA protease-interacting protein 1, mitochondrial [Gavialis gangeticus]
MMKMLVAVLRPVRSLCFEGFSSLIRATFDPDFDPEDFVRGSKRAFVLVSNQLAQSKLDLLEELVSDEVFEVWKKRLALLSDDDKNALAVDMDKIMFASAERTGFYRDSGRYRILKHFLL